MLRLASPMWRRARLRPGCDDGDDDTTIAQSYQDSDCGRHGATFIVWYSRFGPTDSARHPSWGDVPAGVMRSWNSARALAIWLRQCRLGGAWDACCDRFGRTQDYCELQHSHTTIVGLSAGAHLQLGLCGLGRSTMMGAETIVVLGC